ncbi:MAG TPA: hypothetical protein EYH44_00065 [Thermoprotei archaeon]|nr:hypothetical protein [Thermoprotei archaeon]
MPRYVLVYTKKSRKKDVGRVVTYDKNGVIGIFHRKAPLTRELKEGMLVIAKVLSSKARNKNFYILWPVKIVDAEGIPPKYDKGLEVWGRPSYKALKRIKRIYRGDHSK